MRDSVISSTQEILAQLLVLDRGDVTEHSSIVDDLSADSLDIVDLSFQLGRQYAQALKATVLDQNGKAAVMAMGCYGIGVSRIVAAAIEQNHDDAGIIWPVSMAPWQAVVCMINPKQDPTVTAAAEALLAELQAAGVDAALDDRGLRPGQMFADMELIGIPHRIVVSERGLAAGTVEYRARNAAEAENLDQATVIGKIIG